MSSEGFGERSVLAVFDDEVHAEQARRLLIGAGLSPAEIQVGAPGDDVASLRAEMQEEVSNSWIVPQAPFVATREGARGFVVTFVTVLAVAFALGFLVALVDFGFHYWSRLLIVEAIMLVLAFAIALVAGAGIASMRPEVPMAAERGVTLRVGGDPGLVRRILVSLQPIRIDELGADGQPIATLMTEENEGSSPSIAREAGRGVRDLIRNTKTDDFHAPPGTPPRAEG